MPGILHETAVKKALILLGPGAATKGMRGQIRAWMNRASFLDDEGLRSDECAPTARCVDLGDDLFCRACINRMHREELRGWPIVLPDAFRVHRDDPRCNHNERLFVIDVIEIDGSHTLRHKVNRWMDFGDAVDFSDWGLLRLRIFNEHFVQIGEYTEDDLCTMMFGDIVTKARRRKARPDPGWVDVVRRMREEAANG